MANAMTRSALVFSSPGQVLIQDEPAPSPGPDEFALQTLVSLISSGTEMLAYRGNLPEGAPLDSSLSVMQQRVEYPLRYGYSTVGLIDGCGPGTDMDMLGKRVFAFHPHASRITAPAESLIVLPEDLPNEDAVFLANMETAVTLTHDAHPLLGERVLVLGQGAVGLLTTALVSRSGAGEIITCEKIANRRARSLEWGATIAAAPQELPQLLADHPVDLAIELSGSSAGLQAAIDFTAFSGRIVVGSWYGKKQVELELGSRFHRFRQEIISSQVSSIQPGLSARWPKGRRLSLALDLVRELCPSQLITHRFPLQKAQQAYQLLESSPHESLAILFDYPERDGRS